MLHGNHAPERQRFRKLSYGGLMKGWTVGTPDGIAKASIDHARSRLKVKRG
jgi:hypothetical protein